MGKEAKRTRHPREVMTEIGNALLQRQVCVDRLSPVSFQEVEIRRPTREVGTKGAAN